MLVLILFFGFGVAFQLIMQLSLVFSPSTFYCLLLLGLYLYFIYFFYTRGAQVIL